MPSILNKPSEFYDAVVNGIQQRISRDVAVTRYGQFNSETVSGIQVFVEVEDFAAVVLNQDGRFSQKLAVVIHCVVSRAIADADLKTIDLASAIGRIVNLNVWQLGAAVDWPENITAGAGMLSTGENGFEGWEVRFNQTIYLGDIPVVEPVVESVLYATNPNNENDPTEYKEVPLNDGSN